jgi:DNA polymerase Ligase (LigD)
MPRFSILAHDHPAPHWDLFLEAGEVLRSWRLLAPLAAGAVVPAEPTGDHRLLYLDYEGPVSGDRGSVTRVDSGTFIWETNSPEHVVVRIAGKQVSGRLALLHRPDGWSCRFDPE